MSITEEKNGAKPIKTGRGKDVDMTQGNIWKLLLVFALPLLAGNLFQLFYNTVDTWVLGNFATKDAFAAIGTIGPAFNLVVNSFVGLSNGAGVVISQCYGSGRMEDVKRAVHTAVVLTIICAVVFTTFGVSMVDTLVGFMKPSAEMIPHAKVYLRIIFQFVTFQIIYNIAASIMRAVGDSKRPFYYLVAACIINIVLDLVFVIKLGMGADGVAYATVIAQGISALLAVIALIRTDSCVKISAKNLCFDTGIVKRMLKIGIPGALQLALISFSNIFVVSYINHFGTDFASGYSAYFKIEQILYMFITSVSLGTTTFVGQNFGAGNLDRVKKGVYVAIKMSLIPVSILGGIIMIFAPHIIGFFNSDPMVVYYGAFCMRLITPFYLVQCFNQNYTSSLRGIGDTFVPMVIMISCYVLLRQLYLYVATTYIANTVLVVMSGFPLGWVVSCALTVIRYYRTDFDREFAKIKEK